jgi:glycerol-3-phosphate dehydrogenase (NAD(P)+)
LLAAGQSTGQALVEIGQAVEGFVAAKAVYAVAQREHVDMPLCEGVYRVLYEGMPAGEVVRGLMSRPIKAESDA